MLTIDEAILSHPCSLCGAQVNEPCLYRGERNPAIKGWRSPSDQQFYYHAERTDKGCRTYNDQYRPGQCGRGGRGGRGSGEVPADRSFPQTSATSATPATDQTLPIPT